ncbi:MAG: hypothetical protein MI810_03515 [Flavobacteriales bacterium]|nr:hypothetical protein [Flavobacteriales bacterium]
MKALNDWKLIGFACLTLGLAPFTPEPHVWGKLKWVMGGAVGMKFMDWFDLVMHGTPFILLMRIGLLSLIKLAKKSG